MRGIVAIALLAPLVALASGCATEPTYEYRAREMGSVMEFRPAEGERQGSGGMFRIGGRLLLDRKARAPKAKLPEVAPDLGAFLAKDGKSRFIWFGHSTLLLNVEGRVILVDPVFSKAAAPLGLFNRRFQPPVLPLKKLPRVDAILVSHDHYDHLDEKTIRFFRRGATEFIVPLGIGDRLRSWGIPSSRIFELDWEQSAERGGIAYTATPARHSSGRGLKDRYSTLWASWVIKGSRTSLYFTGDSSYGAHFAEIGKSRGPFDLAFIENGQYNERWPWAHMFPEQTVQAAIDLGARIFVPVHWGMFSISFHGWSEPIRSSSAIARERGVPIEAPRLGEVVEIGKERGLDPWWEGIEGPGGAP